MSGDELDDDDDDDDLFCPSDGIDGMAKMAAWLYMPAGWWNAPMTVVLLVAAAAAEPLYTYMRGGDAAALLIVDGGDGILFCFATFPLFHRLSSALLHLVGTDILFRRSWIFMPCPLGRSSIVLSYRAAAFAVQRCTGDAFLYIFWQCWRNDVGGDGRGRGPEQACGLEWPAMANDGVQVQVHAWRRHGGRAWRFYLLYN